MRAMRMNRRLAAAGVLLLLLPAGCRRMTEAEALEAAREDIRREMQPEIDRRQREIEDLKRRIAEARARIAEQEARREKKQAQ